MKKEKNITLNTRSYCDMNLDVSSKSDFTIYSKYQILNHFVKNFRNILKL